MHECKTYVHRCVHLDTHAYFGMRVLSSGASIRRFALFQILDFVCYNSVIEKFLIPTKSTTMNYYPKFFKVSLGGIIIEIHLNSIGTFMQRSTEPHGGMYHWVNRVMYHVTLCEVLRYVFLLWKNEPVIKKFTTNSHRPQNIKNDVFDGKLQDLFFHDF